MTDHEYFMHLALEEARQALAAREFPVGCVLVKDNEIIARGRRSSSSLVGRNELDHAEIVALRNMVNNYPQAQPSEITAYCTMEPCLMCFAALLLSQVHTIVYAYEDAMGGGTALSLAHLPPLYRQMEVQIIPHILRSESLDLFQEFFRSAGNDYWQDSYLAQYTLDQKAGSSR